MTKPKTPWKRGSMTFTNIYAKPINMKTTDWLIEKGDTPRIWTSKSGETPSNFILRILKDMTAKGANITPYLVDELTYPTYTELYDSVRKLTKSNHLGCIHRPKSNSICHCSYCLSVQNLYALGMETYKRNA